MDHWEHAMIPSSDEPRTVWNNVSSVDVAGGGLPESRAIRNGSGG
jgi:hypothetical protein